MNEKQQKRWRELQRDAQKDVGDYLCEKLTYPDIVLLLQQDLQIRTLIREILECSHQEEVVSDDKSTSTDLPVYAYHLSVTRGHKKRVTGCCFGDSAVDSADRV